MLPEREFFKIGHDEVTRILGQKIFKLIFFQEEGRGNRDGKQFH